MPQYRVVLPGDPAPWFRTRTTTNTNYAFDSVGGRYAVLCFFGSASAPHTKAAVEEVLRHPAIFNDDKASFFGVSNDPTDESRVADKYPGYRYFWDFDGAVARQFGALPVDGDGSGKTSVQPRWIVLDPTLRVMAVIPFEADRSDIEAVIRYLNALPSPNKFAGIELQAPILVLPNVFEPAFCEKLIGLYEAHGGEESGFMREVGGKTVMVHDHGHKRRKDFNIEDDVVIKETQNRVLRRIVPEISKVHQFLVTRMERYLVGCYAAEDEAHFNRHRDNTTAGTAHRRFAVSINLNNDFDGGEVSFPEYGPRSFKPPIGGAVVFSCSLLHAVSKVTRGRRYAFLPFLYDDAAAKIREANNAKLGEGVGNYKMSN
jgi:peroxiredoxin/predicted 2-oxoglutarate/Fe(II)-dependent dioxygenase YbiX